MDAPDDTRVVLATPRLLLRTWSPADAPAAFRWLGDPLAMRFVGSGAKPDLAAVSETLERLRRTHAEHGLALWAVVERATGDLIGDCGLMPLEGGPEIEVGYRFRRDAWGRGLATEAAAASVRLGFEERGLERIVAVALPENRASTRVMEKIGLVSQGPRRAYGKECVCYAREREAWRRFAAEHPERFAPGPAPEDRRTPAPTPGER